ncbi:RICIN domain-containing protein [Saccharopolyspora taberi]|uniref:Ricin B lectin domain-containing protein n=1 Tax=Saccharopolyspora taberi TaxID=60895 RepID=A0ABN3VCV1_9PSEU
MTENREFPAPDDAGNAAEFVESMRRLRSWSGLTYRQVEARATANGDVLPYSTLATALRRDSLPRRELTSAFVRACGANPEETARWLACHDRLSAGAGAPVPSREPEAPFPEPGRRRGPRPVTAVSGFVACAGFVVFLLFGPDMVRPPNVHWYVLRTQAGNCLDITGKDGDGNPMVVEAPCRDDPKPAQRFAWEKTDDVYRIKVYNPETGGSTWCLDVGNRDHLRLQGCLETSQTQRFRLEPADGHWRILPLVERECFGLAAGPPQQPREVRRQECTASPDQVFTMEPA